MSHYAGRAMTLAAAALLLPISACSSPTGPSFSFVSSELRWEKNKPDAYNYIYAQVCECLVTGPVLLTVQGEAVTGALPLEGSSIVGSFPDPSTFPTIDDLFARLRSDAVRDPDRFEVEFDEEFGFPRRAVVDPRTQVGDDEYLFEVSGFGPHERLD